MRIMIASFKGREICDEDYDIFKESKIGMRITIASKKVRLL